MREEGGREFECHGLCRHVNKLRVCDPFYFMFAIFNKD